MDSSLSQPSFCKGEITMTKQSPNLVFKGIRKALRKHSPEILTGIGIAGMMITTISAVKATPKALQLIDAREIEDDKRLTKKEMVQTAWKCYIPTAVTGIASVTCLIGGTSVGLRRSAALATAYRLSETALKEYQAKAVEVVGEKKEQAIRDAVAKEQLDKNPLGKNEVIITGKGDVLCFEPLSGRYFQSTKEEIDRAVNNINRQMRYDMSVSLNEFYDSIGLSNCDLGDKLGWDIDQGKGYIDLNYSTQLADDGTPCLVLGHRNPPRYIF